MSLHKKLQARAEAGNPIRVGLIGAGKFGSMLLAQARRLPGLHVVGVVDLSPERARTSLTITGWSPEQFAATSLDDAARTGATYVGDDWRALVGHPAIDLVVEATGAPTAAVDHILGAFENAKHVVNVTVEADAFVGYGLARRAEAAGVRYSMAFGDQPALTCDLVDWARTCGFPVVAAGRGHKWLPHFRSSTPDTVWDYWGLTREEAERMRSNPKMTNSFLDGSKPAIECSAIANACGLDAPEDGLSYPPGGADDIPTLMRPVAEGGTLARKGMVGVLSSLTLEGEAVPYDIRNGVWVCIEADDPFVHQCFEEYKVKTDPSGKYMSLYKRWHLIGLELPYSIASVMLRDEPTGVARAFRADVAAIAKRDLAPGETLDGEGGYTVVGGLRPAALSVAGDFLPLGLAQDVTLKAPVADGQPVRWRDVDIDETSAAVRLRREIEPMAIGGAPAQAAE